VYSQNQTDKKKLAVWRAHFLAPKESYQFCRPLVKEMIASSGRRFDNAFAKDSSRFTDVV
jgi:hypothetical protein